MKKTEMKKTDLKRAYFFLNGLAGRFGLQAEHYQDFSHSGELRHEGISFYPDWVDSKEGDYQYRLATKDAETVFRTPEQALVALTFFVTESGRERKVVPTSTKKVHLRRRRPRCRPRENKNKED